ncbi:hypothetical protein D3C77_399080 [compost metagenome]
MAVAQISHDQLPVAFAAGVVANEFSRRTNLGSQGLAGAFIDIADQHLGAFCREQSRTGAANAVGAAGHQRGFALYSSVH